MSQPLNTFYGEYINTLDLKAIKKHCNRCKDNLECKREIGDHPLTRFAECVELQSYF